MPAVLEYYREQDRRFKAVSDEDLTAFIAETEPSFLKDAEFAASYYKQNPPPSLRPSAVMEAPRSAAIPPLPGALPTPFETGLAQEASQLTERIEGAEGRAVRQMSNVEIAGRYFSDILNPAPVPKLTGEALKAAGVGQVGIGTRRISPEMLAGVERATADLANFFASPLGTATLSIGALPQVAQRVIAGVFAVDLMRTTPEIARQLGDAVGRGDTEAATEYTISGALNTLFAFGTARHALLGEMTPGRAIGRVLMDRMNDPAVKVQLDQAMADEAAQIGIAQENVPGLPAISGEPAFRVGEAREEISVAPLTEATPETPAPALPPETPVEATSKVQAEAPAAAPEAPEIIGMGAAAAGELEPSFRTSTGIKKAAVAEARAERGLEPIGAPIRVPQEAAAAAMKQKLYDDPAYFDLLVEELSDKPRPINSDEVLALDMRYVQLQDEYGRAMREGEQAQADGRADAVIEAKRKADFWDAKLGEFEKMVRATGTHWGRTGAMMQRRMMADFTLEKMEARARQAKGFEPLTPDERAQIKTLHDEIVAKDKAIAAQQDRIGQVEAEKAMLEAKVQAEKGPDYSPAVLEAAERFVKNLEAKSSQYLKDVLGATWSPTPDVLYKTAFIGATKLARLGLDFTRWSAEMVEAIGEKVRPYLADIYERSKAILEDQLAGIAKTEPKETAEKVRRVIKKEDVQGRMDDAKEKIADSLEENDSGNITPQVKKLAEALWIKGIREVNPMIDELQKILSEFIPEISRQETMDALSGRGRFWQAAQDEVKKGVRDLSTQARLLAHQIDVEARRPLPRTGYQPDKMSDAARREQQRLNELKKKFGVVVTDPAKQLASALQASKTYLRNRMTDLKQEIRTRERIVKTRTPLQPDAELEAMRKEYDQVKKEHAEIFQRPELTDQQRLKLAISAAERAEAGWNQRLENARQGKFGSLTQPGKKMTSPELDAIRARTEAVREQVKELHELAFPKKSPAELALQSALTRVKNAIADKLQRMASNDFSKRPKAAPPTNPELLRLKGDLEKIKEQFRAREEKFKFDQLNIFQKSARTAVHTWDALRTLMTTGEFSFVLRQGKFFAASRPLTVARAIPEMLRAFASERNARASELAIREHPLYDLSQKAKLHISREGDSLTRQEEIVMGRWANAIPVVKNFNRAATTFLNHLRFESWLAMRKTMSRLGQPTTAEDAMYARMANESTGRAHLGTAELAAVTLGRMFFAPRYFISRIQLAMGHALWGGTARSRAVIATEYARHLVGMTIYYNLLLFGLNALRKDEKPVKLSFNPRSSDFGKIVIGKTRLDPLAGEAQLATFVGRTITGQTKSTTTGQVTPIRGKVPFGHPTWWEIAGRFTVSKAHPGISALGSLFAGRDLIGNVSSVQTEAGKLVGPITYIDVYQALKAQGIPEGTALAILAFLGEGLQTYQPRQR